MALNIAGKRSVCTPTMRMSGRSARAAALNDLRDVLVRGLRRGLLGRVNTSAPDFDALAEDFVQEALLKILDNLPTFAGRSKFTTWAHKITVHVALSELRRKRWQDASLTALSEPDEGPYIPGLTADPAPDPASLAERRDMLARVNRIITETLSDKQRAALSRKKRQAPRTIASTGLSNRGCTKALPNGWRCTV
jgi:RNA polymerase sigma-70 factor (ECF subfamily)